MIRVMDVVQHAVRVFDGCVNVVVLGSTLSLLWFLFAMHDSLVCGEQVCRHEDVVESKRGDM